MTRDTGTSQAHCLSPISQGFDIQTANKFLQSPFRDFDGCKNGVRGRGFVRSYFFKHINDTHLLNGDEHERCRDKIAHNGTVYGLWEEALFQLRMWLCTKCMLLRAWSKCCRSHKGDIISAPLNDIEANSLVHGIAKPLAKICNLSIHLHLRLPCLIYHMDFLQHILVKTWFLT